MPLRRHCAAADAEFRYFIRRCHAIDAATFSPLFAYAADAARIIFAAADDFRFDSHAAFYAFTLSPLMFIFFAFASYAFRFR